MSAGSVTMACLMLVAGQAPSDVFYTNKTAHGIPVAPLDPARRQAVNKLLLFVSTNRGQAWDQCGSIDPDKGSFLFYATKGDGEYWFRMATLDRGGKQEPEKLHQGPPDQKMVIDTAPPQLKITSAQRLGDEIAVSWDIQEANPDPESLVIEYRLLDGGPGVWIPVPLMPAPRGDARAKLTGPGAVAVRLRMRDLAGNVASTEANTGATGATIQTAFMNPQPGVPSPPPGGGLPPVPPPGPLSPVVPNDVTPPPPAPVQAGGQIMPPPPPPLPGTTQSPVVPNTPAAPSPQPVSEPPVATTQQTAQKPPTSPQQQATPPQAPSRRPAGPIQLVNDKEILIEYELKRVGPGGVGSVMLYLTRDSGQSWEFFAEDPDAGASASGAKYQRTLELPGEGVFGLSLVVLNKAKIGRKAPQAGDAPEMAVEVDMSPPVAELSRPVPDPKQRDALLLRWAARDKNLGDRPVTLEWAERREGPWQVIGADLANTGQHSWVLPPRMPVWVFLRLRVRDRAGNEAVAVTDQPQLIDLTEPESQLLTVRPVQRGQ